jgi:hypothetical protein
MVIAARAGGAAPADGLKRGFAVKVAKDTVPDAVISKAGFFTFIVVFL